MDWSDTVQSVRSITKEHIMVKDNTSSEKVKEVIRKIMVAHDDVIIFDRREASALQEIARIYLGLRSVGNLAIAIKNVLFYVGGIVALYLAWKAKILPEFFTGFIK